MTKRQADFVKAVDDGRDVIELPELTAVQVEIIQRLNKLAQLVDGMSLVGRIHQKIDRLLEMSAGG